MNSNGFKKCKFCGATIAKNARVCPQCGGRNGKSVIHWLLIIAAIFVAVVIAFFVVACFFSGNPYSLSDDVTSMTAEDYQASCEEVEYNTLARNADSMIGEKVKITGEIQYIEFDSDTIGVESEYIVSVVKDEYDMYDLFKNIYLFYDVGVTDKLLEEDIITIYGEVSGYTDYLGDKLPTITAAYVTIDGKLVEPTLEEILDSDDDN